MVWIGAGPLMVAMDMVMAATIPLMDAGVCRPNDFPVESDLTAMLGPLEEENAWEEEVEEELNDDGSSNASMLPFYAKGSSCGGCA